MPMGPCAGHVDDLLMDLARRTIVCGLDGTVLDVDLVRVAARLAEAVAADLHLVHVLDSPHLHDRDEAADRWFASLCEAAGAHPAATHVLRHGDPGRRVAAIAEERSSMLIVVGTRGRAARPDAMLGSVSNRLAADAPCPVLVVSPRMARHVRPESWRGRTLVVGIDGSNVARGVAREAALLAEGLHGNLALVSVGPLWTGADDVLQVVHEVAPRCRARHEARTGDPAWELERVAVASTAPLIAIGSRGAGPSPDALLGPVARRLLVASSRPVMILPATAVMEDGGGTLAERSPRTRAGVT
jgi:nucleotide-binding universal stress UspA family protein